MNAMTTVTKQSTINMLANKLGATHIDNVSVVSRAMKSLKITDATNPNHKQFIGPDYQDDDDYYVITCTGIGENSNLCVKLRVKRKRC